MFKTRMTPRFKPYLGKEEICSVFQSKKYAVEHFEKAFANSFDSNYAISFPYGRSALWAFLKAMGIVNSEIIMPAYTCVVVAHAIVLSGNRPKFVDISLSDYNMDLNSVEKSINEKTAAVIATHLFGYPLDTDRLKEIVREAEIKYGKKIWIIHDCAHSFGARWNGRLVCNEGDAAIFGLNISKTITSVFGGMINFNDVKTYKLVKDFRDSFFAEPRILKSLLRRLYLIPTIVAFDENIYGFVNYLQDETSFLNRLTKAYHLDNIIAFPPDYKDKMTPFEAQIGFIQLKKYNEIVKKREENVVFYNNNLAKLVDWELPPLINGATYSHYVARVYDREKVKKVFLKNKVQIGQLIEYSIPHLPEYKIFGSEHSNYPNSNYCSNHTINLPIYATLSKKQREEVIACLM